MRNVFTRLMAVIALALLLLPGLPISARAAGETGSVTLKNPDAGELLRFEAPNLLPGDRVVKEYVVTTVHDTPITLHYRADIRSDAAYQKLAEVLRIAVELPEKQLTLYDGLMKNMPNSVSHELAADEKTVTYRITVYLDTSVDNEYMNKTLVADFRWWYLEGEGLPITIAAEKTMGKDYASGRKFSFELKDEGGQVVSRVKNEDGHIQFDTLYFANPGTYTYTFSEVKGGDGKITYDPSVFQAVVTVTEDRGMLNASVTYTRNGEAYDGGLPRFTNVKKGDALPEDPSDLNPSNPKTGDGFPLFVLSVICLSSLMALICLFLLWKDRKKEGGL